MFQASSEENPGIYPDISEEHPELMRHHLFNYISQPEFCGLMVKVGRQPVAQIIGNTQTRMFGSPRSFCFIWNFWVHPKFRKSGIIKMLYKDYFGRLKKIGINYWEGNVQDDLADFLLKYPGYASKRLYNRMGGKI